MIIQYLFENDTIFILSQFNSLKHQLSTQRYDPSATAHVVRKTQRRWWLSELLYQIVLQLLRFLDASDVRTTG
jgi:hypothetical protein